MECLTLAESRSLNQTDQQKMVLTTLNRRTVYTASERQIIKARCSQ